MLVNIQRRGWRGTEHRPGSRNIRAPSCQKSTRIFCMALHLRLTTQTLCSTECKHCFDPLKHEDRESEWERERKKISGGHCKSIAWYANFLHGCYPGPGQCSVAWMELELHLNNISSFGFCLMKNTLLLHYKIRQVNNVWGNNHSWFW